MKVREYTESCSRFSVEFPPFWSSGRTSFVYFSFLCAMVSLFFLRNLFRRFGIEWHGAGHIFQIRPVVSKDFEIGWTTKAQVFGRMQQYNLSCMGARASTSPVQLPSIFVTANGFTVCLYRTTESPTIQVLAFDERRIIFLKKRLHWIWYYLQFGVTSILCDVFPSKFIIFPTGKKRRTVTREREKKGTFYAF